MTSEYKIINRRSLFIYYFHENMVLLDLKKCMIIGFYYRPENTNVKWYRMNSTSKFRVG